MKVISLPEGAVQWPIGTTAQWVGRNGTFDSIGVYYYEYDDKVALHPVGARGKIGNCMIEVPKAAIPDLIASLCKALRFSPEKGIASLSKADSDTSTPAPVATGQGERRIKDGQTICEHGDPEPLTCKLCFPTFGEITPMPHGIPRMDADFMKGIERR